VSVASHAAALAASAFASFGALSFGLAEALGSGSGAGGGGGGGAGASSVAEALADAAGFAPFFFFFGVVVVVVPSDVCANAIGAEHIARRTIAAARRERFLRRRGASCRGERPRHTLEPSTRFISHLSAGGSAELACETLRLPAPERAMLY
jgi:hypothetical protein